MSADKATPYHLLPQAATKGGNGTELEKCPLLCRQKGRLTNQPSDKPTVRPTSLPDSRMTSLPDSRRTGRPASRRDGRSAGVQDNRQDGKPTGQQIINNKKKKE
ncbi:hypothetical protein R3O04_010470 [Bacteroides hominis]